MGLCCLRIRRSVLWLLISQILFCSPNGIVIVKVISTRGSVGFVIRCISSIVRIYVPLAVLIWKGVSFVIIKMMRFAMFVRVGTFRMKMGFVCPIALWRIMKKRLRLTL